MMKHNSALTRRSFMKLVGGLSGGLMLAACAPKAAPTAAPAQPGVAKPATPVPAAKARTRISIQTPATVNTMDMVNKCIAEYMEEHPDVEVVSEETIYGEIATKTETGFISGTLQDICYGHNRWYFYGCARGIYRPVDDYIASHPPDDFEDFFPLVMEVNKFEGQQYSLPQFVHAGGNIVFLWNKTILGEAGVAEPEPGWTWEDLAEMAIKCTDKEKGIFGAGWVVGSIHFFENYGRCWGEPTLDDKSGWLMSEDGRTFQFTNPLVEEASKLYLELRKAGAIPGPEDAIEGGLFVAGKQAFTSTGTSGQRSVETQLEGRPDRFEIGWAMRPVGPKGREGTCFSGNHWMLNSTSPNPDIAWDVMKALTDPELEVWGILHGALQPGRRSSWYNERVVQEIPAFKATAEVIDKGLEQFPMPLNLRFVEAEATFVNESNLIWHLERTWDEYAPTVNERVQEILNLDRPS